MNFDFGYAVNVFRDALTKLYWDVDGRTSRRDFWHYIAIYVIIFIPVTIVVSILPFLSILSAVLGLALLAPTIGMGIRRVHDLGMVWWNGIIPFYNLYLAAQPGEQGSNIYGDDPLARATPPAS